MLDCTCTTLDKHWITSRSSTKKKFSSSVVSTRYKLCILMWPFICVIQMRFECPKRTQMNIIFFHVYQQDLQWAEALIKMFDNSIIIPTHNFSFCDRQFVTVNGIIQYLILIMLSHILLFFFSQLCLTWNMRGIKNVESMLSRRETLSWLIFDARSRPSMHDYFETFYQNNRLS